MAGTNKPFNHFTGAFLEELGRWLAWLVIAGR